MDRSGGVVLKTSLDHTKGQALRDALAAHPALALDKEHAAAPATPAA